jgi:hypothetical protein
MTTGTEATGPAYTARLAEFVAGLRTDDADITTARVDTPSGEPGADLTWDTIEAKFHGLANDVLGAGAVVNWVKALPHRRPAGELAPLLRTTPP